MIKYTVNMLAESFFNCLDVYGKIVIYGFGVLGRDIYALCQHRDIQLKIVDRFANSEEVQIIRPDELFIGEDWLVVNTVIDPVEVVKISSDFKLRWPFLNLINCRDYMVLTKDQEKLLHFQSTISSQGYLYETGWLLAYCRDRSVDRDGSPIPWTTYSFISFIEPRLHQEMNVFEFGAGSSTLWFSKRVKHVTSVEHNEDWFNDIKGYESYNISISFQTLDYGGEYSRYANRSDNLFDIIMVDGRDRVNCIIESFNKLSKTGVIILDDAERDQYKAGVEWLIAAGFKKLDFWGIAPGVFNNKCTSVFYRGNNCLGI